MDIEILMSTMNKNNIDELNLKNKNIDNNILIINQTNNTKKYKYENSNIRMYNYNEVGLSKSRNRALENARGNICVIADDDIVYEKEFYDIIKRSFKENPDADIITFQMKDFNDDLYRKYPSEPFFHNKWSIRKVSSVEIAFRLDKIKEKNIKFDENFGLGSMYPVGEENIFLLDCIDKGLKIKYLPKPLLKHPFGGTGQNYSNKVIIARGAMFYRMFNNYSFILDILFSLKKYNQYKHSISFLKFLYLIIKGSTQYKIDY